MVLSPNNRQHGPAGVGESRRLQLSEDALCESLAERFLNALSGRPASHYRVALSGGPDSTALLLLAHACIDADRLSAVHINHHMQAEADAWAQHCQQLCADLGVRCELLDVAVTDDAAGPEGAARQARYAAFEGLLAAEDVLLMAHHRDDQIETLLWRLGQGAGLRGLAGMPDSRTLGHGRLLRPLLEVQRAELIEFLERCQQAAVHDPSNNDTRLARGFLRQRLLPVWREAVPEVDAALARSAENLAESKAFEIYHARRWLLEQSDDKPGINLSRWRVEPAAHQRIYLRQWLHDLGVIHLPARAQLLEFQRQCREAARERTPSLRWSEGELLASRGRLRFRGCQERALPAGYESWWRPAEGSLTLPDRLGELCLRGTKMPSSCGAWLVRSRQGGERVPMSNGHHRSLKKWFQEHDIDVWERQRLPLIYSEGGELLAIGDRWQSRWLRDWLAEHGLRLYWRPARGACQAASD